MSVSTGPVLVETAKGLMALHVAEMTEVEPEVALEAVEAELRTDEIVTGQTVIDTVRRAKARVVEGQ